MSLDQFERAMIARAREEGESPDPSKKAAARRAMFEAAGVAAAVTTVATSGKAAGAATATTKAVGSVAAAKAAFPLVPTLVKAGILVTLVAGGAAGVHVATRSASMPEAASARPAATASPTALPALVTDPPPSAVPAAAPAAIPSDVATVAASALPSARVDAPRPSAKAVDSAGDDPLAAEAKLLARARDALASGDPAAAKAALREHATRFPRGALGNEAELLAIDLAIANGDRAEARRRAALMLAKDPQSPWRTRLQKLIAEAP